MRCEMACLKKYRHDDQVPPEEQYASPVQRKRALMFPDRRNDGDFTAADQVWWRPRKLQLKAHQLARATGELAAKIRDRRSSGDDAENAAQAVQAVAVPGQDDDDADNERCRQECRNPSTYEAMVEACPNAGVCEDFDWVKVGAAH
jgi:hypothetical protein